MSGREAHTASGSGGRGTLRRLLDIARFLRAPDSGLLGQGVRFVIAGGIVSVVYLTLTIALANVFDVPFQIAMAIGFVAGIVVHFSLQRYFVWVHEKEFSLSLHHQLARYLLVAGTQYGTTVVATLFLPSLLHLPVTAVYLGWTVSVTVINFVILGQGIFHPEQAEESEAG